MTTFDQLVLRVRSMLLGFTKDQEQYSSLSLPMASNATYFTVDTATVANLGRGTVEIGDELLLVKSVDQTTGTCVLLGNLNGRGREGTTAAAHSVDDLVAMAPAFPRIRMQEAVNDTIRGVYPTLRVFASTEITRLAPVYEYSMPADAKDVWQVHASTIGPTKIWQVVQNWRFNEDANTTAFATGKSIQLFDAIVPGQTYRVRYAKAPSPLVSSSDDFETVSGLPERCVDMIVYGACARLLPSYEAGRLQQRAIEASERSQYVPSLSAAKAAQYFMGLYQQRLEEERERQIAESPMVQFFQGT